MKRQPPPLIERDVRRAVRGDQRAFEQLYRDHAARVHSLARRLLGSREEADDATQTVFLRAWDRLSSFRGEASFTTWLLRLARNTMLNQVMRGQTAKRRVDLADFDPDRVPARVMSRPEAAMDLESALTHLPHPARTVVVLHDVEGCSHSEIAALLGIAVGTSKSHLHRARMKLRETLSRSPRRAS